MPNFADIAKKKLSEVERPPLVPIGTYTFQVLELPKMDSIADGAWDVVDFQLLAIEPSSDVDPDELAKYGDLRNARIRFRFMFNTQDATAFATTEFRLKQFLEQHLKCSTPDMGISEALNASVGARCLGVVQHRPDKENPEIQYAEVRKTAPLL